MMLFLNQTVYYRYIFTATICNFVTNAIADAV